MSKPARPEAGREEYLSTSEGIGGKLRKVAEDFEVIEFIETDSRSHWNWAKEMDGGRHSIVKITSKNWDNHVLIKELSN